MKRLLVLGGSTRQLPAIQYAESIGCEIIVCDPEPDNPGRGRAAVYYQMDTTDESALWPVAKKHRIHGVVSLGCDPEALTAARLAAALDLPGNPPESVARLLQKNSFRAFLDDAGLPAPPSYPHLETCPAPWPGPVVVKPLDSFGSRGVTRVERAEDLPPAVTAARRHSPSGQVQIEAWLNGKYPFIIGGEFSVYRGALDLLCLLASLRHRSRPSLPVGSRYPLRIPAEEEAEIRQLISKVIARLQLQQGVFNVEVIIDGSGRPYLIEINPRCGGILLPHLVEQVTNVDLIAYTVDCALGIAEPSQPVWSRSAHATHVVYAEDSGVLQNISYSPQLANCLTKELWWYKPGDTVKPMAHTGTALGVLAMKFATEETMTSVLNHIDEHLRIVCQPQ